MQQASKLIKGQRDMLDWIGRHGPVLKTVTIRNDQMRAVNALLQAAYIEACDHPAMHPQSEKPWPALRITDKGRGVLQAGRPRARRSCLICTPGRACARG